MKELSIKEKAERYDELLKKLRKAKEDNNVCDERYCCVIDDIVPELKESEDLEIKSDIQYAVRCAYGDNSSKTERILAWLGKQGEQKHWSEEDEYNYNTILHHLDLRKEKYKKECNQEEQDRYQGLYNWLKPLKDRVQPQNTWKPSDVQLVTLHDAAVHIDKSMFPYPKGILMKLYKQLKKLREE